MWPRAANVSRGQPDLKIDASKQYNYSAINRPTDYLFMSFSESESNCRQWLTQLGQQDNFIGRTDQTVQISDSLEVLNEGLQRLEKDIGSRLLRLMEEVKTDFLKHTQSIEEAKINLQSAFEQLVQSPRNVTANKRASYSLGNQVNLLSRRMRPRMLRALDKLSPKYKTLEKPLKDLSSFRQHAAKPLSEHLWLLRKRNKKLSVEQGKSIFELEFAPRLDKICRSPLFSPLHFTLLRWQCIGRYRFFRLPFKAIVLDCLITRSELNPVRLVQRHTATHDELQRRVSDAWRGIRYNLETAAAELDDIVDNLRSGRSEDLGERPDELRSIVFDALDTCLETFDDVTVTYASFIEAVMSEIEQDHRHALTAVQSGVRDSGSFRTRVRWTIRSMKKDWGKKAEQIKDSAKLNLANREPTGPWNTAVHWVLFVVNLYKRQKPVEESLLQLTDLPTEAELLEQSKVLPPIYRRLFQNEPLSNREFLVGMEAEMNLLSETYKRWQSGKASSVAIVGPEGSGKTSLFNCFEYDIDDNTKVSRVELQHRMQSASDVLTMLEDALHIQEPSKSAAELVNRIMQLDRRIIMIEHGHRLFLRTVGMRETVETFFYVLMNTRGRLFWLVSFRLHPWMRMGYMHQTERFFTHVIKSEFHNTQELKTAILLRQRASGQEPVFNPPDLNSFRLRKLLLQHREQDAPVQQALEDMYFNNLFDITGGNMESALFYWLRSLSLDEQGNIRVQPCIKVDSGFIKKLDTMNMLSLTEVLAHGGLTHKEHAAIFNVEPLRSRLILDYLRQIRLLQGNDKDKHGQPLFYSVNPLFYQPIYSALSDLHLIY
jgi:hypothetical protein